MKLFESHIVFFVQIYLEHDAEIHTWVIKNQNWDNIEHTRPFIFKPLIYNFKSK